MAERADAPHGRRNRNRTLAQGADDEVPEPLEPFERRATAWMAEHGILLLRVALGVVFVWFGALKIVRETPVEGMLSAVVPFVPPAVLVPAVGVLEVAIGLGLLADRLLRVVLVLLVAELLGTFLTFVVLPGAMFVEGNPLLLSSDGEFVVKNLVLIAAALVVGGTRARARDVQEIHT